MNIIYLKSAKQDLYNGFNFYDSQDKGFRLIIFRVHLFGH